MRSSDSGFSLAEMLIATTLMVAIAGAIFGMLQRATETFDTQPEVGDVQQRLRVGVMSLQRDLSTAGAGAYAGDVPSALSRFYAPVMPYRWGDDPARARPDVITVASVPPVAAQGAVLRATLVDPLNAIVDLRADVVARKFEVGMRAVMFEPGGESSLVAVTGTGDRSVNVRSRRPLPAVFAGGGGVIAELVTHTYYLKIDEPARSYQLMHFDGVETNAPVVDNVTALECRYWGDPSPESVELPLAELVDGPWAPDDVDAERYDVDLLRIRRIAVTLRVQAGAEWLRGPASTLFTRAGTGRPWRTVPDQEVTFDVSPPNINLGR